MITIIRGTYILLLSYNTCNVFTYYNVKEMHGLNIVDCTEYKNTTEDAYIEGLVTSSLKNWVNTLIMTQGLYLLTCQDVQMI